MEIFRLHVPLRQQIEDTKHFLEEIINEKSNKQTHTQTNNNLIAQCKLQKLHRNGRNKVSSSPSTQIIKAA